MGVDTGYWTAPCDCTMCAVANTPSVKYPSGRTLHGRPAAQFLASRARGLTRIGEVVDKIRADLGLRAQRGDEPR
jgi:hypothetical protein